MSNPTKARAAGTLAALLSTALAPAAAIPLPAAVAHGDTQFNTGAVMTLDGFGTLSHVLLTHGTLQFSAGGTPAPALTATADLNPVGSGSGVASGFLRYAFEISGPDCTGSGGCVPIFVDAAGHVAGLAGAGAFVGFEAIARWSLRNTSEIILVGDELHISGSDGDASDQGFAESHALLLRTNTEYRVVMEVLARAGGLEPGALSEAEAFVDPVFTFGAGVDPALFSFRFSEGIGNSRPATVREPAAPALPTLALAALVLALRRRAVKRAA